MAATEPVNKGKVGIIGSGLIGRHWSMLFASGGYNVVLYDNQPQQVAGALSDLDIRLKSLEEDGLLRGELSAVQQRSSISGTNSLSECVTGALLVQECVPENLDIKQAVFKQLDDLVDDKAILSSSTSTIPPSSIAGDMVHKNQVIVAHPINPPIFCPLVEVVPSPATESWVTEKTMEMMKGIGQQPVLLKKEVPGFALNRIQYALLMECWRLVQDGVMSPDDIDTVMTEGLGMRYAFVGPLETCHLNAEGLRNYCERYGEAVYNTSCTFGPLPRMGGETAEKIIVDLEKRVPLDKLAERRKWRDGCLAALAKLRKDMDAKK